MDDFTNIFDPTDSQLAVHEDQELAVAGELLVKFAEEEGIDLSKFSETELLGLVNTLRGDGTTEDIDAEHLSNKEASHAMNENQINEVLFDALVTQETAKVAAANELDITSLSVEDLAELRLAVAAEIAEDPDTYFAKSAAEEEFQAKIAESDYLGRLMAHSFADELGIDVEKLAARTPEGLARSAQRREAVSNALRERDKARRAAAQPGTAGAGLLTEDMAKDMKPTSRAAVIAEHTPQKPLPERLGKYKQDRHVDFSAEGMRGLATRANDMAMRIGRKIPGAGIVRDPRARLAIAAGGGLAATGGAAYGAKKLYDRNKRSFDELALERAQEYLASQGIDPSTGEKVAASEAEIEDAINARAIELLEESGWLEV